MDLATVAAITVIMAAVIASLAQYDKAKANLLEIIKDLKSPISKVKKYG